MSDATRWAEYHDDPDHGMQRSPTGEWVRHTDHLAALERVRVEALREARAAVSGLLDAYRDRSGAYSSSERIYHGEMRATADVLTYLDRLIDAATERAEVRIDGEYVRDALRAAANFSACEADPADRRQAAWLYLVGYVANVCGISAAECDELTWLPGGDPA